MPTRQTGEAYTAAKYAKMMAAAHAKHGKTCSLIANALGLMPCQKAGGVVSHPKHLHVITFDSGALTGVKEFLLRSCKAPQEALQYDVLNFQEDARKAFAQVGNGYDGALLANYFKALELIEREIKPGETHMIVVSSLTGLAVALERAMMGGPIKEDGTAKKGYGDQSKWQLFAAWIQEIQNRTQIDTAHVVWETHVTQAYTEAQDNKEPEEKIQVSGKAGTAFPNYVEQLVKVRRVPQKYDGTSVDRVVFDTRPRFGFLAGGRASNDLLAPEEPDLTTMFTKLGLAVGGWKKQ